MTGVVKTNRVKESPKRGELVLNSILQLRIVHINIRGAKQGCDVLQLLND
jgi:hypothetical protein